MKRISIFLISIFLLAQGFTQISGQSFFQGDDRVCFVGNSITNNGEFFHNLLLYHITRFPDQQVYFYNCGISGDVAGGVLSRLEDDILIHNPTHVVIMLGMNDVQRSLYGPEETSDEDTLKRRADAIIRYKENLDKIIHTFLSGNIKVILQKPTIFDQNAKLPAKNNLGVNDALKICGDFIEEESKKYGLPIVDYWTIMNQINQKMQEKDPASTLTGPDRVHPASPGHLVMTYQFLKSENAPRYVSKITIRKNLEKSSLNSLNCKIDSFSKTKSVVSFSIKENSLPFPATVNQKEALTFVPFIQEFNVELLQVNSLKKGLYNLEIDGNKMGSFSDDQLKMGINLSVLTNTPQYLQALEVKNELDKLWQMESTLRGIKFIEYNQHFEALSKKESDREKLKAQLDSVFTKNYAHHAGYYKKQLEKYFLNKPMEDTLTHDSEIIRGKVFSTAHPEAHLFSISLIN